MAGCTISPLAFTMAMEVIIRASNNIGLYGHGALELPVSSLTEEYKCTKVRLNMTLTESQDGMIKRLPQTGNWEEVDAI
ncbi:hypothetical protein AAFF_G00121370 [Aldrovandia affinis]|uniref:Uncharacterized protein n=1 Tax=Aldrovandia affinis TaxID=143900 RepID=A0AAD7RS90_9TELE|nr:hypothetical protein AAFF_G00121370 [Aldrovandia affinis]